MDRFTFWILYLLWYLPFQYAIFSAIFRNIYGNKYKKDIIICIIWCFLLQLSICIWQIHETSIEIQKSETILKNSGWVRYTPEVWEERYSRSLKK
jgi:hypothetical protein